MRLMVVGLNHTTASVAVRERVTVQENELTDVLLHLIQHEAVQECIVLSTCNRAEIYAVVQSPRVGADVLKACFIDRAGSSHGDILQHLYTHSGEQAARHIMTVASGLDSLVIGETQILGQVRHAFHAALESGTSHTVLNQLFRMAIQVGKRAQTETTIGQNPVSISYAAVQLARKIYGDLHGRKALVLGAGKMSDLTAQHLVSHGISDLYVANRTLANAATIADKYHGQTVAWDSVTSVLGQMDIVISSTGAPSVILSRQDVVRAMNGRGTRPMALIDIAMPRDIDASIGDLKQVYLYDIDDLQGVVEANLAERERQGTVVKQMIAEALRDFQVWLTELEVVPIIAALREKGTTIRASVMESLERKLPDLSDREHKVIEKHLASVVNQLLRDPIQHVKEFAAVPGGEQQVQMIAYVLGLDQASTDVRDFVDESIQQKDRQTITSRAFAQKDGVRGILSATMESSSSKRQGEPLHPLLR